MGENTYTNPAGGIMEELSWIVEAGEVAEKFGRIAKSMKDMQNQRLAVEQIVNGDEFATLVIDNEPLSRSVDIQFKCSMRQPILDLIDIYIRTQIAKARALDFKKMEFFYAMGDPFTAMSNPVVLEKLQAIQPQPVAKKQDPGSRRYDFVGFGQDMKYTPGEQLELRARREVFTNLGSQIAQIAEGGMDNEPKYPF